MTITDAVDLFDDYLNEFPVDVAGLSYRASYVLRQCDPIAYRELFWDWVDSENLDLENADDSYALP